MVMMNATSATTSFVAPGPGQWVLDRSHYPGGTTPIAIELMETAMAAGMRRVFAEIGTPADCLEARFVNGFMYTRLRPLIAPDKAATRVPPAPVLWLASRLHPEMRRRARTAAATLVTRPWIAVVDRWEHELKPGLVARNNAFQDEDPATLTDAELAGHVSRLLAHLHETAELHFWLHGYDLGPLALYLHDCRGWGIPAAEALTALAGASPSTAAPAHRLARLRALVEAAGAQPTTLDEVRATSPEAAALLDEYLAEQGENLVTGYDLDGPRLVELPATVLRSVLEATLPPEHDHEVVAASLRDRVPPGERATFDQHLRDARAVMDVRDDNGPKTFEWPAGLLRRALLEVGARVAAQGRLHERQHVFDATSAELGALLRGEGPTADELQRRAVRRDQQRQLDPPPTLGPAEATPDPSILPAPLPRLINMVQTALAALGMAGEHGPAGGQGAGAAGERLRGAGIGDTMYRGPVRRASSAEDAIESMEPGDVLVVRATSPAFNAVLGIAGAVITVDGGPMSHAAVLARELGIPAVVGVPGALGLTDGALVEVDAAAGQVRVL